MDIMSLILPSVLIIAGSIVTFIEKYKENKNEGKPNQFNKWGLVFVVAGAVWAFVYSCNSQRLNEKSGLKVDSFNNVLTSKQSTIDSITKVLNKKQNTIINKQKESLDTANSILTRSIELSKSQNENNKKQDDIIKNQNREFANAKEILSQSIALNNSQIENNKKQDNIIKNQSRDFDTAKLILSQSLLLNQKQEELLKEVTGSDTKPILILDAVKSMDVFMLALGLYNQGDYPIQGCYLDITCFYSTSNDSIESIIIHGNPFDIAPSTTKYWLDNSYKSFKTGTSYSFNINVYWKRGQYTALVEFSYPIDAETGSLQGKVRFLDSHGFPIPENYFDIPNKPRFKYPRWIHVN